MESAVLWIVIGIALALAEIFTTTLFLVMFSAGAFAAAAAAALGAPVLLQVIVFAVVSALSVGAVRPAIRRYRQDGAASDGQASIGAIEGSSATVLEQVDAERGMVKIGGELWTARSYDGTEVYRAGERVRVIEVRGATVMVWHDEMPMG